MESRNCKEFGVKGWHEKKGSGEEGQVADFVDGLNGGHSRIQSLDFDGNGSSGV